MIRVEDLSLIIDKKTILNNINIEIEENMVYVFIGLNGSGKTSFFYSFLDLYKSRYNGNIYIDNINIKELNSKELANKISFNLQIKNTPDLIVYELLSMARYSKKNFNIKLNDIDIVIINRAIELCNIKDLLERRMTTLSGGERQLVYIAMSIIQDSKYIILDEPTTYLDYNNKKKIYNIINELKKLNKTLLISLHDINDISLIADKVVIINNGSIDSIFNINEINNINRIEEIFNVEKYVFNDMIIYK